MDDAQQNHLKAYGLTFNALKTGNKAEWFLNYRGGSFLLPDEADVRRRATLDGITFEAIDNARVQQIRSERLRRLPSTRRPRLRPGMTP